jgi:hypothetical protein
MALIKGEAAAASTDCLMKSRLVDRPGKLPSSFMANAALLSSRAK